MCQNILNMKPNSGRFKKGEKQTAEIRKKAEETRLKNELWKKKPTYHGMNHTKIYNCWRSMITRCNGTAGKDSIKKYKDKGITVCDKWKMFNGFYEDMGETFKEGLTIDRINNYKGYFKENCRWATKEEQANNKRNMVKFNVNGETMTLRDISNKFNLDYPKIRNMYANYLKRYYYKFIPELCKLIPNTTILEAQRMDFIS